MTIWDSSHNISAQNLTLPRVQTSQGFNPRLWLSQYNLRLRECQWYMIILDITH
jgi:hypothetical protein